MSLKEVITETESLKNDLKLAKNKINDRILSGGGTKANTISEVPGKIDEMLGNYKKVAYITLNKSTKIYYDDDVFDFQLNYSLNFKPSRIFIVARTFTGDTSINTLDGQEYFVIDSEYHNFTSFKKGDPISVEYNPNITTNYNRDFIAIYKDSLNNSSVKLRIYISALGRFVQEKIEFCSLIAVE